MRAAALIALAAVLAMPACQCAGLNAKEPAVNRPATSLFGERTTGARQGGSPGNQAGEGGATATKCRPTGQAVSDATVVESGAGTAEDRLFGRSPAKVRVPAPLPPCP